MCFAILKILLIYHTVHFFWGTRYILQVITHFCQYQYVRLADDTEQSLVLKLLKKEWKLHVPEPELVISVIGGKENLKEKRLFERAIREVSMKNQFITGGIIFFLFDLNYFSPCILQFFVRGYSKMYPLIWNSASTISCVENSNSLFK